MVRMATVPERGSMYAFAPAAATDGDGDDGRNARADAARLLHAVGFAYSGSGSGGGGGGGGGSAGEVSEATRIYRERVARAAEKDRTSRPAHVGFYPPTLADGSAPATALWRCSHCYIGARDTPSFRRGPLGPNVRRTPRPWGGTAADAHRAVCSWAQTLCNACGLSFAQKRVLPPLRRNLYRDHPATVTIAGRAAAARAALATDDASSHSGAGA
jgi:hypothetical protein